MLTSLFTSEKLEEAANLMKEKGINQDFVTFPDHFFEKNYKKVHWLLIQENVYLQEHIIEKYANFVFWERIGYNNHLLSDDFLWKHRNRLNWNFISSYRNLSPEKIYKFRNFVDWKEICFHQNIDEDFIRKNIAFIDFGWINYQDVSETFLSENIDKVDGHKLVKSKTLSPKFIEQHLSVLPAGSLLLHQNFLTPKLIVAILNKTPENVSFHGLVLSRGSNVSYEMFSDPKVLKLLKPHISNHVFQDLERIYGLVCKMQQNVLKKLYKPGTGVMFFKTMKHFESIKQK